MANIMDKFFSVFGKLMLVVLVLGSMAYGGYYFGTQSKFSTKPEAVTVDNGLTSTVAPVVIATPSPTPLLTVVAGLPKSAGLSFDQFSIMTPSDWVSKKESQSAMDEKLTLTKEGHTITIFQAATGGALCLYPQDPAFEGPSSKYEVFTALNTKDGKMLRRSGDKNGTSFTICQKGLDSSYQQPTSYGHISIKLPINFNPEILTEIDSIISSLKKI